MAEYETAAAHEDGPAERRALRAIVYVAIARAIIGVFRVSN